MATTVQGIEKFHDLVGQHLGYSEWHRIEQAQINLFADATGDHQWIHVDPERAVAGPFGHTIAHGYLTLSLIPVLLGGVMKVDGVAMGVNYGTNKVRFTSPVPVGSKWPSRSPWKSKMRPSPPASRRSSFATTFD